MTALNINQFRERFPEFESVIDYPDARIEFYWEMANCYLNLQLCYGLTDECAQIMLELMTAHLAKLADLAAEDDVNGMAQSATVDRVSISLTPPPIPNQFQWWLGTTNYGQQLLAMMQLKAVGGLFYGGTPEIASFRKAGGIF